MPRLFLGAMFAVLLSISSAHNAFAGTWLIYDDGSPSGGIAANFVGVRFSLPSSRKARILTVRFSLSQTYASVIIHITAADHVTHLTPPMPIMTSGPWTDVDLSGRNIIVDGDFYVIIEDTGHVGAALDYEDNYGRSFYGSTMSGMTNQAPTDLLIRAEILVGAVGGIIKARNAMALLAPYLALICLLVTVPVVYVARKRLR